MKKIIVPIDIIPNYNFNFDNWKALGFGYLGMKENSYFATTDGIGRKVLVYGNGLIVEEDTGRILRYPDNYSLTDLYASSYPQGYKQYALPYSQNMFSNPMPSLTAPANNSAIAPRTISPELSLALIQALVILGAIAIICLTMYLISKK